MLYVYMHIWQRHQVETTRPSWGGKTILKSHSYNELVGRDFIIMLMRLGISRFVSKFY